jgi:hypothetical protein
VQKLKSAPKGFTLRIKAEIEKICKSIYPNLLINAELYSLGLAPWLKKKRIATNLGSQFTTFGANVLAFTSKLGQKNKPKMLKVGPNFFCHDS